MADDALRAPARYLSDSSLPLSKQTRFDDASEAAVTHIHRLLSGYSIRLDILASTIQAFKVAVENGGRSPHLDTYYVVNLLEAIEALIPDTDSFMERAEETVAKVDDLWRELTGPEESTAEAMRQLAALVDGAVRDHKLLPAQRDWATRLGESNIQTLREYLSRPDVDPASDTVPVAADAAGPVEAAPAAPDRKSKRARREALVGSAA